MKPFPLIGGRFYHIHNRVDHILATKARNPTADVSVLEAEIDQRVYALYGLTAEEIKIVEERGR